MDVKDQECWVWDRYINAAGTARLLPYVSVELVEEKGWIVALPMKRESCSQRIDRLMFTVEFESGAWFVVCENCAPDPDGSTKYTMKVFDLLKERERWEETSS